MIARLILTVSGRMHKSLADFTEFDELSVRFGITTQDLIGGIIKPLFFGLIIGSVSCHKGLSTTGGTVGVGRSTTNSVVLSSIVVIIFDFFLSRAINSIFDIKTI